MSRDTSTIPLYFWADKPNFGDAMSAALVKLVTGRDVRHVPKNFKGKLVGIGSVLQVAGNEDVVWGSGIHPRSFKTPIERRHQWLHRNRPYAKPTVLSVRGPLTRDVLMSAGVDCPRIYGDPALLLPTFFTPSAAGRRKVGYVPHYRDQPAVAERGLEFIDVQDDWQQVVNSIASCDHVIASSLHGVIVAEAYGIPAVWWRTFSGEGWVKFADYYASTGRLPDPAYSLEEAAARTPIPPPEIEARPVADALASFDLNRLGVA